MRNRIIVRREQTPCASSKPSSRDNIRFADNITAQPRRMDIAKVTETVLPKKSAQVATDKPTKEERFRKADEALFGGNFDERLRQVRLLGLKFDN